MNRPHFHAGMGRGCSGIESRVLDVVTHELDPVFTEGLYIEERSTMGQPKLSVVGPLQAKLEVHELVGGPDIQLKILENRADIVTHEPHGTLHTRRINRARRHPLLDGKVHVGVAPETLGHEGQAYPVLEMTIQQIFSAQPRQCLTRKMSEAYARVK
jgi:hypothetical protein